MMNKSFAKVSPELEKKDCEELVERQSEPQEDRRE